MTIWICPKCQVELKILKNVYARDSEYNCNYTLWRCPKCRTEAIEILPYTSVVATKEEDVIDLNPIKR